MTRARDGHVWIVGDGPRGARGARCDRCKSRGLRRAKRNGYRAYWWPNEAATSTSPDCDKTKLQAKLDLEGHAASTQLVPPIEGTTST